jgi:hypothetical protein
MEQIAGKQACEVAYSQFPSDRRRNLGAAREQTRRLMSHRAKLLKAVEA